MVALTLGWCAGLVLAGVCAAAAIGLWIVLAWAMAHRRERWRVVAAVALAAVVAGLGFASAGAWRAHAVQSHPIRDFSGRGVEVVAVVTDDPKPVRGAGFGGQRRWVVRAGLREFGSGPVRVRGRGDLVVLASGAAWERLGPGQEIRFRARVSEPNRPDLTVAALHAQDVPELIGRPPWWQRWAAAVRTDLADSAQRGLSTDAAGLLPAMVVGDTAQLSDRVRDSFEIAGLQHLNVVSGANFTILLTVALALLRVVSAGPRTSAAVAVLVVGMFVVVARPDPSVLRAAAMGSVTVLSLVTGRRKQALPALCAATIGLLAVTPALALSAGFALSVVATAGLILLAPSWADWLRARGWWRAPAEVIAVAAAAFVVTLPLMVALSGRISLVAIIANVLVAPVVGVITVIGAAGALVAVLSTGAGAAVLWCAALPLWWLLTVADTAAGIPGATLTVPSGIAGGVAAACGVVLGIVALRSGLVRRLCVVVVLGVTTVLVPVRLWHPFWPTPGWVVAMCDIGQGDAFAVSTGPGSAVVIDVGPDPRPVRRCLDRLRIQHIPLLVLTHPHADHIAGLEGALHHRTVDAIATAPAELHTVATRICPDRTVTTPAAGSIPNPRPHPIATAGPSAAGGASGAEQTGRQTADAGRADPSTVVAGPAGPGESCAGRRPTAEATPPSGVTDIPKTAAAHGVPLMELHSGHSFTFGRIALEVLAPGPEPPASLAQDEANDRSLVLRARTPAGTVLFTGDIESAAQQRLLVTEDVRADILKVPHHGSRTTTPEFLTAVRPVLALTSAGRDNSFGHPHPKTVAALEQLGATVARTDRDGDVLVLGTPGSLRIVRARPRRCRSGSVGSQRDSPPRTPAARRRGTAGRTRDGADNPRGPRRRAGPGRRPGRSPARR